MLRKLLFLLFLTLALIGCDSSSGGSVGTTGINGGGASQPASAPEVARGDLRFSFLRAQATLVVPSQTVRVRFSFTDQPTGEGNLVFETSREFAATIIVTGVPISARSVRVTALDSTGSPLLTELAEVTVVEGQTTTVTFNALDEVVATEIVLEPQSVDLQVGGTRQFTAQIRLSDGSTVNASLVEWSSTGSAAIVNSTGLVTAVAPGQASVNAQIGSLSAEAEITVNPSPPEPPDPLTLTGFSLDRDELALEVGTSFTLLATGTFLNGTQRPLSNAQDGLTYGSSHENIATVDDAGRVSAVAEGVATITATAGNFTDQVEVQVREAPAGSNEVPVIDPHITYPNIIAQGIGPFLVMPEVTVTDDQSDLGGGELRLVTYYHPDPYVIVLQAPGSPDIGTIVGNGTDTVTVSIASGVTPGEIAQFLRDIQMTVTGPQGTGGVVIELDDNDGHTGTSFVEVDVRSTQVLHLTVNLGLAVEGTNFHNPQAAIDLISGYGADESSITLMPGDYRAITPEDGNYEVYAHDAPNFTIYGANAGVPVGTAAQSRAPETIISSVTIWNYGRAYVSIDGLTFDPNRITSTDGLYGIFAFSNSFAVRNCIFGTSNQDFAISDFGGGSLRRPSIIEDCRIQNIGGGFGLYGGYYEIRRNVFSGLYQAMYVEAPYIANPNGPDFLMRDNAFFNNTQHLFFYVNSPFESDISNNDFSNTGYMELHSESTQSLDLRNNWWGQASGPRDEQLRNETESAEILTTPFLTVDPLPALP